MILPIFPVDILVNKAGITRDITRRGLDKVNWDALLRTNPAYIPCISKPLCEWHVDRSWRCISNISSANGPKVSVSQINYAAAETGMHGVTKSLSPEVAARE